MIYFFRLLGIRFVKFDRNIPKININTNDGSFRKSLPISYAKIKRAKELYKEGYKKTDILKIIIKEFKLERDLSSRSWPKWLSNI